MTVRFSVQASEALAREIDAEAAARGSSRSRTATAMLAEAVADRYWRGEYARSVAACQGALVAAGAVDEARVEEMEAQRRAELRDVPRKLRGREGGADAEEIQLAGLDAMRRQVDELRAMCAEHGIDVGGAGDGGWMGA